MLAPYSGTEREPIWFGAFCWGSGNAVTLDGVSRRIPAGSNITPLPVNEPLFVGKAQVRRLTRSFASHLNAA